MNFNKLELKIIIHSWVAALFFSFYKKIMVEHWGKMKKKNGMTINEWLVHRNRDKIQRMWIKRLVPYY